MLLVKYEHCDTEWFDLYECACDSECPVCGKDIEATTWADPAHLFKCTEVLEAM